MDKQHRKRVRRTRKSTEAKINLDSLKHTWILVKKSSSIHDRLAIEMNKCLQETDKQMPIRNRYTRMNDKRKDPCPQKEPLPLITTDP